uniref:PUB domain-containing protein n=1 Tax=Arcella intermedia TaxID=1963864 RepID=A0A6B2LJG5_9EUKA
MRRELHIPTLLATLETLSKVIHNILDHPDEDKYRKIPITNKAFAEKVTDRKGGKAFLLACGFLRKTMEGKDVWYLGQTGTDIAVLELARDEVVDKRKNEIHGAMLAEQRRDEREKAENAKRAEKVKRDFEEDRDEWEQRVEMTGGVKDSVAQDFVDRTERMNRGPSPELLGQGGNTLDDDNDN